MARQLDNLIAWFKSLPRLTQELWVTAAIYALVVAAWSTMA
jgi:hypothetical protein